MLLRDTFRSGKTVEAARNEKQNSGQCLNLVGGMRSPGRRNQKEGVDVCAYNPLFINWVRVLHVHFFNTLKKNILLHYGLSQDIDYTPVLYSESVSRSVVSSSL